jgi:hypothetical protein
LPNAFKSTRIFRSSRLHPTDGAPGLIRAVEAASARPGPPTLQPAQQASDCQWPEIAIRARVCYEAASPALATRRREDFVQAYGCALPTVVLCFQAIRDELQHVWSLTREA